MFVIGSDVEVGDFLCNLQFVFNPATFGGDLSRVYNWQFNIYPTELKSQAAVLMRHSLHSKRQLPVFTLIKMD